MNYIELAQALGWTFLPKQPDKWYRRFEKDGVIFDLWPSTTTIRIIKDNIPMYYKNNNDSDIERLLSEN